MGIAGATRTCLARYATFSGRAGRPEYWYFLLAVVIASVVLALVDTAIFGAADSGGRPLTGLFQLAMFMPLFSAAWRRLQDSGRPGWYALLPMLFSLGFAILTLLGVFLVSAAVEGGVPADEQARGLLALIGLTGLTIIGLIQLALSILMLWWLTRPSDAGANAYGPPPMPV